jgi:hypothetical protein
VGLKDKGVILTEALYQVRAHLVNKMVVVAVRAEIEAMQALFLKTAPAQPRKSPVHPRTGHMLELNTTDLHLGKLAWGRETAPAQPPRIMRTTNRMSFCVISLFAEGRTAEG